jgi:glycosyltransferase involved in cell wall biosynthesis
VRLLSVIHGPAYGGAHNQLRTLAAPLAERGIKTIAVLPEEAEAAAERLAEDGIETLRVPLGRLRATPNPAVQLRFGAGFWPDVRRLRRLVEEHRADVVQAHGPTNPQAALAARRAGAGVVWQLLDTRAPMALRRATMPLVTRLADAVTSWGEQLAVEHPGAIDLGDRLIVVFPPVDTSRFTPSAGARAAARHRLEIQADAPTVGTVGVLNPQKGHEHLVRAAEILARDRPDLALRIIGASSPAHASYERDLRAEALARGLGGRLEFVDPGDSVPELVQALDVFVLTSVPRSEGMPTAILEAMACERPVVAARVGAVAELVEDGVTGLLVEPEDPASVAGAVGRLLDDPGLRAGMGAAGRRRALERFGLDRLADLHAGAYRLAAERRGG